MMTILVVLHATGFKIFRWKLYNGNKWDYPTLTLHTELTSLGEIDELTDFVSSSQYTDFNPFCAGPENIWAPLNKFELVISDPHS